MTSKAPLRGHHAVRVALVEYLAPTLRGLQSPEMLYLLLHGLDRSDFTDDTAMVVDGVLAGMEMKSPESFRDKAVMWPFPDQYEALLQEKAEAWAELHKNMQEQVARIWERHSPDWMAQVVRQVVMNYSPEVLQKAVDEMVFVNEEPNDEPTREETA